MPNPSGPTPEVLSQVDANGHGAAAEGVATLERPRPPRAVEPLPATRRALLARLAATQTADRLPSVVAGVVRDGALVWSARRGTTVEGPGEAGDGDPADTQYRIGSITKSLTAVLLMRLRDEGRLDLADPLDRHVPGTSLGDRRLGDLLSHAAGVPAEPEGPWWERSVGVGWDALRDRLGGPEGRRASGPRFHYSNVGFALLGRVVEELRGVPWPRALHDEVLAPLGMARTGRLPSGRRARGYAVHPWADLVLAEPATEQGAMAPAGELWSTIGDLARWAAFLCGDTGDVLSPDTLAEMAVPRAHDDGVVGGEAYGLGLQIVDAGYAGDTVATRRLVGHFGSVPGFQAGLLADRVTGDAAITLTNSTSGGRALAVGLLRTLDTHEPHQPAAWTPGPALPEDLLGLLGIWYWGPAPYALRARGPEVLDLAPLGGAGRPARFRREAAGTWRGVNGYFAGESLRAVRRPDGTVGRLDIATFHYTRDPYDPADMVAGGVDPAGWHGMG